MAGGYGKTLEETPTWAVAGVCAVIILISIALEKILHKVGSWLINRHKKALYEALEKIKAELMLLGFISLTLVFCQYYIADICIPKNVAKTMLPCPRKPDNAKGGYRRRVLSYERRVLAGGTGTCKPGYEQLISVGGLHEIHILIFFLAVFHVVYSLITVALGRLKCRRWKQWEQETTSNDYEFSNDPSRFRLTHETSFVRAHTSFWTRIPFFFYIGCFLRQFFRSVSKSDYLTLRHGFIAVHLAPGRKFNFRKYIKRSLEDDFKTVVGVSPLLWTTFVMFLLLNVKGWQTLFWVSLIPLIIILVVGTKLEEILTKMALQIADRHEVVQGMPLVQASDKFFWFSQPRLVLHLIHFALFQNAFQLTYFLWITYEYKVSSCFHDNFGLVIARICIGVGVLLVCSYITLPLYALIAQMGSHMKTSIFEEQTTKALKNWHMAVKKKHDAGGGPITRTLGDGGGASPASSIGSPFQPAAGSAAVLQRFKTIGHTGRSSLVYNDGDDGSNLEDPSMRPASRLVIRRNPLERDGNRIQLGSEVDTDRDRGGEETRNEDDISFAKTATSIHK